MKAILLSIGLAALMGGQLFAAKHSMLWGAAGEKWSPQSRLPDFSHAGYHRGEKALPNVPPGVSVRDFGAKGDGVIDDTKAFLAALAKVERGAIEVPPGRYRITDLLEITRSGVVLRGAGPDKTVLVFPTPLNDIKPNWGATTTGQRTSNYSWSGGFVVVRGGFGSQVLAEISGTIPRGEKAVTVSSAAKLRVGQEVEVYQSDLPDNSLAVHLYSGDAGPVENLKGRARTSLVARVKSIDGDRVTLDRPLRSDLRQEWKPRLRAFEPTVTESGVEHIGFEFPVTPYKGHFTELGFNPVTLSGVAHCWVRNIRVRNADSGPYVSGAFNTVDGVVLESERPLDNQKCNGHHGISLSGTDNLVMNVDIRTRFIHDITVSGYCSGNVIARGRGADLSLDHHRYAPNENLFTDLDAGAGTRLWKCGGGAALGKHCGARGTFWNIRSASPLSYPPAAFGPPTMNLVGLQTKQPTEVALDGKWFEAIPPPELQPQNLYEAQLRRRLGTK
ncbi:MAG: glycosyl hydrolase family 28-related protein [Verrucomicrobia bacterium]|nr:glycosyl hydrolase family 28-related protein [Verrucomicrobiota bacterium]